MTLDPTGITIKRLADLRAEFRADVAASPVLGPSWQVGEGSIIGQIADPILARLSELYELSKQTVDAFDPDQAEGVWLDMLCATLGIVREPATFTAGILQLDGVATTIVPAGTQFRVPNGPIVELTAAVELTGAPDDGAYAAIIIGKVEILAGTITEIVTPVTGLSSVTNAADGTTGRERETDSELRRRRETSLVAPSASTDFGIGSALRQLPSVTYAAALSDRIAHTVRCLVYPDTADQAAIAAVIWNTVPAGILMIGAQTVTVEDSTGTKQEVSWDWIDELTLTIVVTVTGIVDTPSNQDLIKSAIIGRVAEYGPGNDVYADQLKAAVMVALDPEPETITLTINGGASQAIELDEIPVTSIGNITVTILP